MVGLVLAGWKATIASGMLVLASLLCSLRWVWRFHFPLTSCAQVDAVNNAASGRFFDGEG
jgi:hypothetical protein